MAVETLNQSDPGSTYGAITAERYKSGELDDWIVAADAGNCARICQMKGHGRRKDFFAVAVGVAFGAQIGTHVGPVESVQFLITGGPLVGTRAPAPWGLDSLAELERENQNVLLLTTLKPHWILDGDTVYHNAAGLILAGASSIVVQVVTCQFTLTTLCQASSEFTRADALGSLAALFLKDGQREAAGNLFATMHEKEMAAQGLGGGA